jgi:hypothetical protein
MLCLTAIKFQQVVSNELLIQIRQLRRDCLFLDLPAFKRANSAAINEQQNEFGVILSDFEMMERVLFGGV